MDADGDASDDEVVTGTPGAVMAELRASARGFARSFRTPSLAKALVALIAFGMTEWAAYIALIVYAFAEGGTARVGLVSTLTLLWLRSWPRSARCSATDIAGNGC